MGLLPNERVTTGASRLPIDRAGPYFWFFCTRYCEQEFVAISRHLRYNIRNLFDDSQAIVWLTGCGVDRAVPQSVTIMPYILQAPGRMSLSTTLKIGICLSASLVHPLFSIAFGSNTSCRKDAFLSSKDKTAPSILCPRKRSSDSLAQPSCSLWSCLRV